MLLANIHNRIKERQKVKNTPRWERRPREYIENNFYIRTKEKTTELLKFNPIQEKYWNTKTKRDIILKPRQLGFSTLTLARFFECVINEENVTAVVVAHDSESTQKLFKMVRLMYDRLPESKKDQLNNGRKRPKIGNRKEYYFEGNNSTIYVGTAGADKFGRGQTINYVLCSEVAFWDKPEDIMMGLLEAVPEDGEIVIESTANGVGTYYYDTFFEGKLQSASEWTSHFYAWYEHPPYRTKLIPGETFTLDEEEQDLVDNHGVTLEQIKWRRRKIANMPKKADRSKEDSFRQEYPANDLEAFLSTGRPVFAQKVVRSRITQLELKYAAEQPVRGNFLYAYYETDKILESSIRFVPDENGVVTIYKRPEPRRPYVLGGDIAEGGKDFSAGQMLDNISGEQVAVWHGHTDTDLYGKQMYCFCNYYNRALAAIEINFDSHPVKELRRLGYWHQYNRENLDDYDEPELAKHGFRTTVLTRPIIIAELVAIVRETVHVVNDLATLYEMLSFIRNEMGRPEASPGKHDDLIMALAIAYQARGQQSMELAHEETYDDDYEPAFGRTGY